MFEDQGQGNREDEERNDQVSEAIAKSIFILREVSGQGQDDRNLGQFRRLKGEEAELEPALGAGGCTPEDHDQQ